jgi:CBS-domain-containing membrane protein
MKVEKLMTRSVATCGPQDTLDYAASLMWQNDCGCLPVIHINGTAQVCGMITDRDICMSALFKGKALGELRVEDAMAKDLQTCQPGDTLAVVERKMQNSRIRRLPVVDEAGALVGIVSMADLASAAARLQYGQRRDIPGSEVTTTLAAICKPARDPLPTA